MKPWRQDVKDAAIASGIRVNGAVYVEMIFTMIKPKSAPKTRRSWPSSKPDLSKLVRSTEDALTDAGLWEDDGRVVGCLALKVFPLEHKDALERPGVVIRVHPATADAPLQQTLFGGAR